MTESTSNPRPGDVLARTVKNHGPDDRMIELDQHVRLDGSNRLRIGMERVHGHIATSTVREVPPQIEIEERVFAARINDPQKRAWQPGIWIKSSTGEEVARTTEEIKPGAAGVRVQLLATTVPKGDLAFGGRGVTVLGIDESTVRRGTRRIVGSAMAADPIEFEYDDPYDLAPPLDPQDDYARGYNAGFGQGWASATELYTARGTNLLTTWRYSIYEWLRRDEPRLARQEAQREADEQDRRRRGWEQAPEWARTAATRAELADHVVTVIPIGRRRVINL